MSFSHEKCRECEECPVGSFANVTGSSACILCPIGTYQSGSGKDSCINCTAGAESRLVISKEILSIHDSYYLDDPETEMADCAIVSSQLAYCNSLVYEHQKQLMKPSCVHLCYSLSKGFYT